MTFALNTSHALYANLKMFIGVDESNQLVDLVTPSRTFTKHANAVYGTGVLGRYFGVRSSGFSVYGADFDPFTPVNNTGTLVIVTSSSLGTDDNSYFTILGHAAGESGYQMPNLLITTPKYRCAQWNGAGVVMTDQSTTSSTTTATARMISFVRDGMTSFSLSVNGVEEVAGTAFGANAVTADGINYSRIGGADGFGPATFDLVYAMWFDKPLSPTEVSDLYATLGASNAFGLLAGAPAATATTLSGPSSGTVSVASTNFTVGANGTITGTVVVTPADGGAVGTFTPTTVSISSGTPTGTFTYTPASTGAKTISTTNNGSLSNPTSLTYTSNAAGGSIPAPFFFQMMIGASDV